MIRALIEAIAGLLRWLADLFAKPRSAPPVDTGAVLARAEAGRKAEDRRRKAEAARAHKAATDQLRTDLKHPPRTAADMVADAEARLERLKRDDE